MNHRFFLRSLVAAAAAAVFAVPAFAQAPIVIKFSHVVAADTPKGQASEFFAKRAAELTKGKVKGTGIGTYSAKMMVKAQGGDIFMSTSDEDSETVVTVRLPY